MAPNLLEWAHLYGLYFILSLWWHGWKDAWSEVVVMVVMAEATNIDHHHHNHEYVQLYFLKPL